MVFHGQWWLSSSKIEFLWWLILLVPWYIRKHFVFCLKATIMPHFDCWQVVPLSLPMLSMQREGGREVKERMGACSAVFSRLWQEEREGGVWETWGIETCERAQQWPLSCPSAVHLPWGSAYIDPKTLSFRKERQRGGGFCNGCFVCWGLLSIRTSSQPFSFLLGH